MRQSKKTKEYKVITVSSILTLSLLLLFFVSGVALLIEGICIQGFLLVFSYGFIIAQYIYSIWRNYKLDYVIGYQVLEAISDNKPYSSFRSVRKYQNMRYLPKFHNVNIDNTFFHWICEMDSDVEEYNVLVLDGTYACIKKGELVTYRLIDLGKGEDCMCAKCNGHHTRLIGCYDYDEPEILGSGSTKRTHYQDAKFCPDCGDYLGIWDTELKMYVLRSNPLTVANCNVCDASDYAIECKAEISDRQRAKYCPNCGKPLGKWDWRQHKYIALEESNGVSR